jgi:hypothetical protein
MSLIGRRWAFGVLAVIAACTATCVVTGCASATTAGGTANPLVAGSYYDSIVLVNHSAGACQLAGYPNLSYTDASGTTKPVPTVPEASAGPPYTLAAGGQVQFTIHTANGYSGYSSTSPQCAHPMVYRGLSVQVSGGLVPLPNVGIDLKCGDIRLSAWGAPQPQ